MMPFSRQTRAEHDKHIFKVQNFIGGVVFKPKCNFVVAHLAYATVTKQTGDFQMSITSSKNFVWDPIQRTYCSESSGASFAPKKVRK
jgi:hypothetical protein